MLKLLEDISRIQQRSRYRFSKLSLDVDAVDAAACRLLLLLTRNILLRHNTVGDVRCAIFYASLSYDHDMLPPLWKQVQANTVRVLVDNLPEDNDEAAKAVLARCHFWLEFIYMFNADDSKAEIMLYQRPSEN